MEELDIDSDRMIDPDALDVEWLEQPNTFYKYSDALDNATNERNELKVQLDRLKDKVDTVKAQTELDIRRSDPKDYDLDKFTDNTIKALVQADPDVQAAIEEYHNAKEELNNAQNTVNHLFTCVNTMQEKKASLERLVYLLNLNYFAVPEEPRNLQQEHFKKYQKIKQNQTKAKEKIKSKKRRAKNE